jgi:hypothetical protein
MYRSRMNLVFVTLFMPGHLIAQVTPTPHRVSLALEVGPAIGGPGSSLITQMTIAGYGDTRPAACGGYIKVCWQTQDYPRRRDSGIGWTVTAQIDRSSRLGLRAGYGLISLGGAEGFDLRGVDPYSPYPGEWLSSAWDAQGTFVEVVLRPRPHLSWSGGPSLYRLKPRLGGRGGAAAPTPSAVSRMGITSRINITMPRMTRSRFYLNLGMRGHLIPSTNVEEYSTEFYSSLDVVVVRPKWSHLTLTAGGGVRW